MNMPMKKIQLKLYTAIILQTPFFFIPNNNHNTLHYPTSGFADMKIKDYDLMVSSHISSILAFGVSLDSHKLTIRRFRFILKY